MLCSRALEAGKRLFEIRDLDFEARDLVFDGALPVFHLAELDRIQAAQLVVFCGVRAFGGLIAAGAGFRAALLCFLWDGRSAASRRRRRRFCASR